MPELPRAAHVPPRQQHAAACNLRARHPRHRKQYDHVELHGLWCGLRMPGRRGASRRMPPWQQRSRPQDTQVHRVHRRVLPKRERCHSMPFL
eukprot:6034560-Prymnesium_polylepis.2